MKRVKLSDNFYLDEYIPKELYLHYEKIDKLHILIGLIDNRLIESDQRLRDIFGPITINNWWDGGNRQWSGLRTEECPQYSYTSQHSFGRASDKLFKDVTIEEVRKDIVKEWKYYKITCIEDNVSWLHSDVRYIKDQKELLIVNP